MEVDTRGRRLFFLGAGFSKPAGLPLATELLPLVLSELERINGGETHVHWALDEYLDFVDATSGVRVPPDEVDVEDFVAYLDHEHYFGMLGSDTFSEAGNRPQLLLRWGIGRVLWTAMPTPLSDLYLHFAEQLRPGDVVATFNYDLIVETALTTVGKSFRRFPYRMERVYAMHGEGTPRD